MTVSNTSILASASLTIDSAVANTAVTVKASSAVLFEIELDNTAVAAATYLKFWNTGTVTVGTTVPDWVVMVPASVSRTVVIPSGLTFGTALSYAATTAGGTSGNTATTGDFAIKLVYV